MKTKIVKTVFPAMAFICAITAAFAFSPAPEGAAALVLGATKVGSQCTNTNTSCSVQQTPMICKDASGNSLFRYIGATSCPDQLWKRIN